MALPHTCAIMTRGLSARQQHDPRPTSLLCHRSFRTNAAIVRDVLMPALAEEIVSIEHPSLCRDLTAQCDLHILISFALDPRFVLCINAHTTTFSSCAMCSSLSELQPCIFWFSFVSARSGLGQRQIDVGNSPHSCSGADSNSNEVMLCTAARAVHRFRSYLVRHSQFCYIGI
jgi:hypothetical protein